VSDAATVVLVHGAWHGGWCWEKVVPLLEEKGVRAVTFDMPMTSLDDDVAATRAVLDGVEGPVVLCGHSYGGAVITAAGHHQAVEHLVYLTAFALEEGETPAATAPDAHVPSTDLGDALVLDGTSATIKPDLLVDAFYHDCNAADADAAVARLRPIELACVATLSGPPAWKHKPATYVVCTDDHAIHPELQRLMGKRCSEAVEWNTAHSPFLNRPDLVADLLVEVANR